MSIRNIIKKILKGKNLQDRVTRGGIWLGIGSGGEQFMRLVRNMILTRILAPEAFGLMAIVLAINAAFESFSQIGIREAIIQNPRGQEKTYLNGAWWLSFLRAVGLYAMVYVSTPWIAQFYQNPDLVPLMRVAFLSLIFNGLMSPAAYVTVKKMQFGKWVLIYHGGGICGILTAITLGFILQNVWALVIGFTIEALIRCILSYLMCPFLPRFDFEREHLQALFKYARGMLGLPLLTFIFMKTDIFVVGKIFSMADLGLYSMASVMAWLPFQFLTMLMGQIMLPAFSEKQEEKEWLNQWTLNITSLIVFCSMPPALLVTLYGRDILALIYGTPYGTVSVPFALIFFTAFIRTASVPIVAIYLATGHPELHRRFTAIRAILLLAVIFPAVMWLGLAGAALAGLSAMAVGYLFQLKRMRAITGLEIKSYLRIFPPALLISLSIVILWIMTQNLFVSRPLLHITPGIIGCMIAYGITLSFFMKSKIESFSYVNFQTKTWSREE